MQTIGFLRGKKKERARPWAKARDMALLKYMLKKVALGGDLLIACDRVFGLQAKLQSCHHCEWQPRTWAVGLARNDVFRIGDVLEG